MTLHRFLRSFRERPRLLSSAVLGVAVGWLVPDALAHSTATRALIGWNVFALLYLALAIRMMWCAKHEHILANAVRQDDGRYTVLTLVMLSSGAVLAAVGTQLADVRAMHGVVRSAHLALAALTVLSAWFFTQTSFALHYAHDFFLARRCGRAETLAFPGTPDPRYFDFLYFACVIGTSAQTADVSFTSSASRAVGLGHCVQAFFFNTMVLALTINIAAGLF
jgi:uncharacterized membrane protein